MDTFRGHLQLSALCDLDRLGGAVAGLGLGLLDLLDDVEALEDLAEDDVTAIEPTVTMGLAQFRGCVALIYVGEGMLTR